VHTISEKAIQFRHLHYNGNGNDRPEHSQKKFQDKNFHKFQDT